MNQKKKSALYEERLKKKRKINLINNLFTIVFFVCYLCYCFSMLLPKTKELLKDPNSSVMSMGVDIDVKEKNGVKTYTPTYIYTVEDNVYKCKLKSTNVLPKDENIEITYKRDYPQECLNNKPFGLNSNDTFTIIAFSIFIIVPLIVIIIAIKKILVKK